MAAVERHVRAPLRALGLLLPGIRYDEPVFEYYKYSPWKKKDRKTEPNDQNDTRTDAKSAYHPPPRSHRGLPVITEATWQDLAEHVPTSPRAQFALQIYTDSWLPHDKLEPEEEFLRNYIVEKSHLSDFILHRSRAESAVYGDLPLRHWFALCIALSESYNHWPLGVTTLAAFIRDYGAPLHQNTRNLGQIREETGNVQVALFIEMCVNESIQEFNIVARTMESRCEDKLTDFGFPVSCVDVLRELFLMMLPHPKCICNRLRATYSWFVKCWGVASPTVQLLTSSASDDRNAKDVVYERFCTIENPYAETITQMDFFAKSLKANLEKLDETVTYAQSLSPHVPGLTLFRRMLTRVYTTPFFPCSPQHMLMASVMLAMQTMSGYGRAWVKNAGDDPAKMLAPTSTNYVSRVAAMTANYFVRAYEEASAHGFDIIPPEEMYTSLLRLAKNTSSGYLTEVSVEKRYGPRAQAKKEIVRLTSRQKALYLLAHGDKIYSPAMMLKKYNTPSSFQTRGSRDVPIKATRTIYAINVEVLAAQHLLTLPLNEYFAKGRGSTHPSDSTLGGKVIIGDLEATGSRVIDAADTFRNTGDPMIWTLALDYSEYDSHMTWHNFRSGMLRGMRDYLSKFSYYRYGEWTIEDMIESGYGEGRVRATLWNGKRAVRKMSRDAYNRLSSHDTDPPDDAPIKSRPPGTFPIRTLALALEPSEGQPFILVAPWDGSDLALVTTHLSGENSTLVANSLHNLAMGRIIQEEVARRNPGAFEVLSEMYVGDDTLHYTRPLTRDPAILDGALTTIFETIERCGHVASPAKTTYLPFSAEKTQTHSKQGVYIPQDRMMIISSERPKNIEDVQGYMRSQASTFTTKVSRGFSHDLAMIIYCFKASLVGYRKLKATVKTGGMYVQREFFGVDDGFTLVRVPHPSIAFAPLEWGGYGVSPYSMNVVNTPELHSDMLMAVPDYVRWTRSDHCFIAFPPSWNETTADDSILRAQTPAGLFSRLARRTVRAVLTDQHLSEEIRRIPLGELGPHGLSRKMMHQAMMKESRARALISPAYEAQYRADLNAWRPVAAIGGARKREIGSEFVKMFRIDVSALPTPPSRAHPDLNLSPSFLVQKQLLGPRASSRLRMNYAERIDSILRGDLVMRGVVTSNYIMSLLERIGADHNPDDLACVFELLNLTPKVSRALAEYVTKDRVRFDTLLLHKGGAGGDEFSMSLNVGTESSAEECYTFPSEFRPVERDASILHCDQLRMTLAASLGFHSALTLSVSPEHREKVRKARIKARTASARLVRSVARSARSASLALVEAQFT
ncbi:RNA-dependent RNA polymerase [Wad Medani virus]|uniref:RNA-directed RNA polymerase n=1 Tax=Wad Medani virus TaxID=40067 RepID=A0A0H4M910_9REOV|nr:RNA-dependent RNA polymerase [Wad Medani virus]AKP24073.1 RNA-dependent RNA polymerase [Wad Medani virus]